MKTTALLVAAVAVVAAFALGSAQPQRPTSPPPEGRFQVVQVRYLVDDFMAAKVNQPEETLMLLDSATGDTWTYKKQVVRGNPTGDPAMDEKLNVAEVQSFWTPVVR